MTENAQQLCGVPSSPSRCECHQTRTAPSSGGRTERGLRTSTLVLQQLRVCTRLGTMGQKWRSGPEPHRPYTRAHWTAQGTQSSLQEPHRLGHGKLTRARHPVGPTDPPGPTTPHHATSNPSPSVPCCPEPSPRHHCLSVLPGPSLAISAAPLRLTEPGGRSAPGCRT